MHVFNECCEPCSSRCMAFCKSVRYVSFTIIMENDLQDATRSTTFQLVCLHNEYRRWFRMAEGRQIAASRIRTCSCFVWYWFMGSAHRPQCFLSVPRSSRTNPTHPSSGRVFGGTADRWATQVSLLQLERGQQVYCTAGWGGGAEHADAEPWKHCRVAERFQLASHDERRASAHWSRFGLGPVVGPIWVCFGIALLTARSGWSPSQEFGVSGRTDFLRNLESAYACPILAARNFKLVGDWSTAVGHPYRARREEDGGGGGGSSCFKMLKPPLV